MRARIDISELEAETKIRAKYLRALENEEWDLLPGPTYVKSFLRSYADALGLDGRLLVLLRPRAGGRGRAALPRRTPLQEHRDPGRGCAHPQPARAPGVEHDVAQARGLQAEAAGGGGYRVGDVLAGEDGVAHGRRRSLRWARSAGLAMIRKVTACCTTEQRLDESQ